MIALILLLNFLFTSGLIVFTILGSLIASG